MNDPLKPLPALLVKLGSICVHAEEFISTDGHALDRVALESLLNDSEVREWFSAMNKLSLLPVKRTKGDNQ